MGVALGGRQRSVAEQLLDGTQIRPGVEQVGREGVAQRVRRRMVGQAQRRTQLAELALDDGGLLAPQGLQSIASGRLVVLELPGGGGMFAPANGGDSR